MNKATIHLKWSMTLVKGTMELLQLSVSMPFGHTPTQYSQYYSFNLFNDTTYATSYLSWSKTLHQHARNQMHQVEGEEQLYNTLVRRGKRTCRARYTYCHAHGQDVGMESWCQSHSLQMLEYLYVADLEYRFRYWHGHGDKGQVHWEQLLHLPTNVYKWHRFSHVPSMSFQVFTQWRRSCILDDDQVVPWLQQQVYPGLRYSYQEILDSKWAYWAFLYINDTTSSHTFVYFGSINRWIIHWYKNNVL